MLQGCPARSCGFRVDGTISKGVVDIDLHIKVYTVYIYIYTKHLWVCAICSETTRFIAKIGQSALPHEIAFDPSS